MNLGVASWRWREVEVTSWCAATGGVIDLAGRGRRTGRRGDVRRGWRRDEVAGHWKHPELERGEHKEMRDQILLLHSFSSFNLPDHETLTTGPTWCLYLIPGLGHPHPTPNPWFQLSVAGPPRCPSPTKGLIHQLKYVLHNRTSTLIKIKNDFVDGYLIMLTVNN